MANDKIKTVARVSIVTILLMVGLVAVVALGYVGYVAITYYRLGDTALDVYNNQTAKITNADIGNKEFKISTYNIGFGAYDRDYSFFMDSSVYKEEYVDTHDKAGQSGLHARGASKDNIIFNTEGAYNTISNYEAFDFMLYQEVDTSSTRSYKVNQLDMGNETFDDYGSVYAVNYHSAYLAYPFNEPIGQSNSGITTYSKYNVNDASRHEFKITDSFFGKFFDLDRAFTISQLPIEGSSKKLYIFNVHMSAYDENGVVRKLQLAQLVEAIKLARDINGENNYVVVGGDFNHDLLIDNPTQNADYLANIFDKQETDILKTDWYNYLRLDAASDGMIKENLITGEEETYAYDFKNLDLTAYGPSNIGTCRDASLPFEDANDNGIVDNSMVTIDGFLVSNNIQVNNITTIGSGAGLQEETLDPSDPRYGLGFVYSDHNPVAMDFVLKN